MEALYKMVDELRFRVQALEERIKLLELAQNKADHERAELEKIIENFGTVELRYHIQMWLRKGAN